MMLHCCNRLCCRCDDVVGISTLDVVGISTLVDVVAADAYVVDSMSHFVCVVDSHGVQCTHALHETLHCTPCIRIECNRKRDNQRHAK